MPGSRAVSACCCSRRQPGRHSKVGAEFPDPTTGRSVKSSPIRGLPPRGDRAMTLNRRDFVASVGLSLVGTAAARSAAANEPAAVPAVDGNSDWATVRAQFNLDPAWMHFSQFYIVSHPKPVRDAIERYRN